MRPCAHASLSITLTALVRLCAHLLVPVLGLRLVMKELSVKWGKLGYSPFVPTHSLVGGMAE